LRKPENPATLFRYEELHRREFHERAPALFTASVVLFRGGKNSYVAMHLTQVLSIGGGHLESPTAEELFRRNRVEIDGLLH